MNFLKQHYKVLIVGIVGLLFLFSFIYNTNKEDEIDNNLISLNTEVKEENEKKQMFVDVKGAVKKPGVYKITNESIVNDAIKLAGGLKSSAYTKNINLSAALKDEMVIYVFSKAEIKELKKANMSVNDVTNPICTTEVIEVNNCPEITNPGVNKNNVENTLSSSKIENKKVNINTASKEELMTVSGIGSSKADAIIAYRLEHKFETVEDIQKVSGIGASTFEKIKDNLTV